MEVSGQLHPPVALSPRETAPGNHWIGGWAGPTVGLDTVVKKIPSTSRDSNPRSSSPYELQVDLQYLQELVKH